jgi:Fe2+ or Zn2+ uptake regulation protein
MIDDIILKEIQKDDFVWTSELYRRMVKKGVPTSEPTIMRAIKRLQEEGRIEMKICGKNKMVRYVYSENDAAGLSEKILKMLSKDMFVSAKQIKDKIPSLNDSELMKIMKSLEESKKIERLQIGTSVSWKRKENA